MERAVAVWVLLALSCGGSKPPVDVPKPPPTYEPPPEPPRPTPPPPAPETQERNGLVDAQRIALECEEGKEAKAALQASFDRRQRELDTEQTELGKLKDDIAATEKKTGKPDPRAAAFGKRLEKLRARFVQSQKELEEEEEKLTGPMVERMRKLAGELAESRGLRIVLTPEGEVLWAASGADAKAPRVKRRASIDLTDEVLDKMNRAR